RRAAGARPAQPLRARARGPAAGGARVVRGALDGRGWQRLAGDRPRPARARPCVPAGRRLADAKDGDTHMALKLPRLFGEKPAQLADDDYDVPTTQAKMGGGPAAPAGYDPLASVSIMEQLRTAQATASAPRKLWLTGNLPLEKQEQVVALLLLPFL